MPVLTPDWSEPWSGAKLCMLFCDFLADDVIYGRWLRRELVFDDTLPAPHARELATDENDGNERRAA